MYVMSIYVALMFSCKHKLVSVVMLATENVPTNNQNLDRICALSWPLKEMTEQSRT